MEPLSWLNAGALLASSIVSTALVIVAVGAGPLRAMNATFALFGLAASGWAVAALLTDLSLWLGRGDPQLLAELAMLFILLLSPFLLSFSARFVGAGTRAVDAAALVGLVAVAAFCFPLFRHEVVASPRLAAHGTAVLEVKPLAVVAAGVTALYLSWSLALFVRRRGAIRDPWMVVGVAALFAALADGLLQPPFPLMTWSTAASVFVLGYGVTRRQVLNPLRETAAALEAKVIERAHAEGAIAERARRLELLATVGRETTGILDLDDLLRRAVGLVCDTFRYYNVSILLVEGDSLCLLAASRGEMRRHEGTLRLRVGGEGITGRVAASGLPILVPDVALDERYMKCDEEVKTRSELAVPIRSKGSVAGVLDAQSAEVGAFTELDVFTLQTVADQLAVAIENARLYREVRRRAERLAVVNRVAAAAGSSMEVGALLERVHGEIDAVLRPDAFFVALYEEAAAELDYRFAVDQGTVAPPARRPLGTGLSSRVVATGAPVLVRDVADLDQGALQRWGSMRLPGSWLGVPMRLAGRVTGVMSVQAYRTGAYGEEEQQLLLTLADQVAVAVERARLYEAVRRELADRAAAEEKFRTLAEQSPNMIFINAGGRVVYANERCSEVVGYAPEDLTAPDFDFMRLIAPENVADVRAAYARHLAGEEVPPYEYVVVSRDGRRIDALITTRLVDYGGERGILGIITDISLRKRTERLLRGLNAAALVMERELEPGRVFPALGEELGRLGLATTVMVRDEERGGLRVEYASRGAAAERLPAAEAWLRVSVDRRTLFAPAREGGPAAVVAPLVVDEEVAGLLAVESADLTAEDGPTVTAFANQVAAAWRKTRLVEELERSMAEVARAQAQVLQSAKMEAIGRLAGGVAHDFNNLLTAIGGYAELIRESVSSGAPEQGFAAEISATVERAAALTRQLLAFGRKQVVAPRIVDVNAVVGGLEGLLGRLIGEHVELSISLAPSLPPVLADPTQIEQAIMNLAINARDAMPRGGTLSIATAVVDVLGEAPAPAPAAASAAGRRAPPGRYATITVSDTGVGMGAEVLSHIFEPFFTTKERGKGTGLGLSTVYGIVTQAGGHVEVDSSPGRGSTFVVSLPAAGGEAVVADLPAADADAPGGTETILVVEDEAAVRDLAASILRGQGYTVLEADRAARALEVCAAEASLALVLTDIVMPGGMSGVDLAGRLAAERPRVRILCMSGYAPEDPGLPFLQKPFTYRGLCRKVREVLDS